MKQRFVIGLPAYNEDKNIGKLLDKIHELRSKLGDQLSVIIINDGSTDRTEEILKAYSKQYEYIGYINHHQNMGLGAAMDTLLRYGVKNLDDIDVLITFDADNTHNPNIIPGMIKTLQQNNLDIVIASRFVKGGRELGLSPVRRLFSRGAMIFCMLVFNISNVRDYSCGYRAYSISFLKKLLNAYGENLISSRGFECMVEILAKSGKLQSKVGEYPLVLEYYLKEGTSKMNVKKTIMGYVRLAIKVRKPRSYRSIV